MKFKVITAVLALMCINVVIARPDNPSYEIAAKVDPADKLSANWAFVIDTSNSIVDFNLFDAVISGFTEATSYPSDQLRFCMYAFNNQGCWSYRKWADMPHQKDSNGKVTEQWSKLIYWLYGNTGTMSYGAGAISRALHNKVKNLTVIIISDGGFTEGGEFIMKIIKGAQRWRVSQGYGKALITTIGIENMACAPYYPKPSNKICQEWMRDIGVTGRGGYFYVHKSKLEDHTSKEALKEK